MEDKNQQIETPEAKIRCQETGEEFDSMEEFEQHREEVMRDAALDAVANWLNEGPMSNTVEEVEAATGMSFGEAVDEAISEHNSRSQMPVNENLVEADKERVAGAVYRFVSFKMLNKQADS